MQGAPGIALVNLLASAKPHVICDLIDDSLLKLLWEVNPKFLAFDRLADTKVFNHLVDPVEILNRKEQRDLIIDLLPIEKAIELADRLTVPINKHIYQSLKIGASNPAARLTLESFFGVVRKPSSKSIEKPTKGTLQSQYGLYEHQRKAVSEVENLLKKSPHKVVLHMPTGSGKTRTSMHIVANHLRGQTGTVVCWLAYSSELLEQAASELEIAWNHLGDRPLGIVRLWGNRVNDLLDLKDGVVVAGLSKMHALDKRYPNRLPQFADRTSLIVIDEAHQSIAPTYARVLDSLYTKQPKNALLGLTATPGRTWSDIAEDRKLSEYFERKKVTLAVEGFPNPVQYLIDKDYLAKPVFHQLNSNPNVSLSHKDQRNLTNSVDIPRKILEMLGRDVNRNKSIVSKIRELMQRHHRTLVFTPSVESAHTINSVLRVHDIQSDVLTGKTSQEERESIIARFRSSGGPPRVLLNFGVLTTGFDAPSTSAALIARPTRSLVLYSQMVGRATRGKRVGGNAHAEIVTVVDTRLPGFGSISEAFTNWEDVWHER